MFGIARKRSFLPLALFLSISLGTTILPLMAEDSCGEGGAVATSSKPSTTTAVDQINPDWYIEAQAGLSKTEFQHECFSMRSIVESSIKYYEVGKQDRKNNYERIWYHSGRALGLERSAGLNIPPDKNIAIRIVDTACATSIDEDRASANVIMRLALDVLLNRDNIAVVEVPSSSYQAILQELQARNAKTLPFGEKPPVGASVSFQFQSESTGLRQTVYFM